MRLIYIYLCLQIRLLSEKNNRLTAALDMMKSRARHRPDIPRISSTPGLTGMSPNFVDPSIKSEHISSRKLVTMGQMQQRLYGDDEMGSNSPRSLNDDGNSSAVGQSIADNQVLEYFYILVCDVLFYGLICCFHIRLSQVQSSVRILFNNSLVTTKILYFHHKHLMQKYINHL
jgi:hypothetical protein